jgi:mercuric ion binding protein
MGNGLQHPGRLDVKPHDPPLGGLMKALMLVSFLFLSSQSIASEIHVKVKGMVCSMCAQGIQKKFTAQKAVESVKVNLDEKFVLIHTKKGEELSDEEVTKIISEAGYNVAEIKRK